MNFLAANVNETRIERQSIVASDSSTKSNIDLASCLASSVDIKFLTNSTAVFIPSANAFPNQEATDFPLNSP